VCVTCLAVPGRQEDAGVAVTCGVGCSECRSLHAHRSNRSPAAFSVTYEVSRDPFGIVAPRPQRRSDVWFGVAQAEHECGEAEAAEHALPIMRNKSLSLKALDHRMFVMSGLRPWTSDAFLGGCAGAGRPKAQSRPLMWLSNRPRATGTPSSACRAPMQPRRGISRAPAIARHVKVMPGIAKAQTAPTAPPHRAGSAQGTACVRQRLRRNSRRGGGQLRRRGADKVVVIAGSEWSRKRKMIGSVTWLASRRLSLGGRIAGCRVHRGRPSALATPPPSA